MRGLERHAEVSVIGGTFAGQRAVIAGSAGAGRHVVRLKETGAAHIVCSEHLRLGKMPRRLEQPPKVEVEVRMLVSQGTNVNTAEFLAAAQGGSAMDYLERLGVLADGGLHVVGLLVLDGDGNPLHAQGQMIPPFNTRS